MSAIQLMSASEIYKKYVEPHNTPEHTTTFKEWISIEKIQYRLAEPKSSFDRFLNLKYRRQGFGWWGYFCAEGDKDKFVKKHQIDLDKIMTAVADKINKPETSADYPDKSVPTKDEEVPELKKSRLLGMPPAVTWGLVGVLAISLTWAGIVLVKRIKRKHSIK